MDRMGLGSRYCSRLSPATRADRRPAGSGWRLGPGSVLHFLDIDDWRSSLAPRIEAGEAPVPAYRA
ncbi:MAG: hypothetical protein M8467_19405, partial [Anaerolineae bacterium]|nr:hypothetical protein [Anaerolineae bacterium]